MRTDFGHSSEKKYLDVRPAEEHVFESNEFSREKTVRMFERGMTKKGMINSDPRHYVN